MSGVSPVGIAENGTRSGKVYLHWLFVRLVIPNLPSCLPSLAEGLVPAGQHYYEGSESSARASQVCTPLRPPCLSRLNLRTFRLQQPYCHFARLGLTRYRFHSPCEPPRRPAESTAARSWASSGTLCEVRGSRVARSLPDRLGRIEFTCVTDCSFVSGCSPPFLLKTQLPSTTGR